MELPYTDEGTGYQNTDTSLNAALLAKPKRLRDRVYALILGVKPFGIFSAEDIAHHLRCDPASVKPRLTELQSLGKIKDSGARGKTRMGRSCILWTIV